MKTLTLSELLDDYRISLDAMIRRFLPEGYVVQLCGTPSDDPTLWLGQASFAGVLGTVDGHPVFEVPLKLLAVFVEQLPQNIVRRRSGAMTNVRTDQFSQLQIPANPLPWPSVIRFFNGTEHAMTLLECIDGDGFDLATSDGKVLFCELDNQLVNAFARFMPVESNS